MKSVKGSKSRGPPWRKVVHLLASICLLLLLSAVATAQEQTATHTNRSLRGFGNESGNVCDERAKDFTICTSKHIGKCLKCKRPPSKSSCEAFERWYNSNEHCCYNDQCSRDLKALKACKNCQTPPPTPAPTPRGGSGKVSVEDSESVLEWTISLTLLLCFLAGHLSNPATNATPDTPSSTLWFGKSKCRGVFQMC